MNTSTVPEVTEFDFRFPCSFCTTIRSETNTHNCTLSIWMEQKRPWRDNRFLSDRETFKYLIWNVVTRSRCWLLFCTKLIKPHPIIRVPWSPFNIIPPFYPCYSKWLVQVLWQCFVYGLLFFPKIAWWLLQLNMRVSVHIIIIPSQIFQKNFSWRILLWVRIEDGILSVNQDTSSVQFCLFVTQKRKVCQTESYFIN